MLRLLLLFVALPAVELALLIEIGSRFGTLHTIALIVATGFLGAALARRQGLGVLTKIRDDTAEGRIPAVPIADGVMILVASALLVTPGVLTDAFGFSLLVPAFRAFVRRQVWKRVDTAVQQEGLHIDVDFRRNDPED